jgi:hypothetical protein
VLWGGGDAKDSRWPSPARPKISHGHRAFFTTKVFAYYGGSVRIGVDVETD